MKKLHEKKSPCGLFLSKHQKGDSASALPDFRPGPPSSFFLDVLFINFRVVNFRKACYYAKKQNVKRRASCSD